MFAGWCWGLLRLQNAPTGPLLLGCSVGLACTAAGLGVEPASQPGLQAAHTSSLVHMMFEQAGAGTGRADFLAPAVQIHTSKMTTNSFLAADVDLLVLAGAACPSTMLPAR